MFLFKSIYVSLYITASVGGLALALVNVASLGVASPWVGTAVACAGPVVFFASVFTLPIARTSPNLYPVLAAGVAGTLLSVLLGASVASTPVLLAAIVGVAGTVVYVRWYSRFGEPTNSALREGNALPDFSVVEDGREVSSATLLGRPALWIFYRGNWCPLCVAQIKEIAGQYRELARRGIDVFLVSPQPEENSVALAERCDAPMRFLTDHGNRAARILGILVKNGLPAGMQAMGHDSDVPRPAVFITAADGTIAYCDLTDNYRVRPEPAQYLGVFDRLAPA